MNLTKTLDDTTLDLATRTYDTVLLTESTSPLDHLRKQADIHQAHTAVQAHYRAKSQVERAVEDAVDHTVNTFPATLGSVLWDEHWTGFPALEQADDAHGSAAAHLGNGVWVHHTVTTSSFDDGHSTRWQVSKRHALTLITPCTCGRGYRTADVSTEEELLTAVHTLIAEPSSSKHGFRRLCGSVNSAT